MDGLRIQLALSTFMVYLMRSCTEKRVVMGCIILHVIYTLIDVMLTDYSNLSFAQPARVGERSRNVSTKAE